MKNTSLRDKKRAISCVNRESEKHCQRHTCYLPIYLLVHGGALREARTMVRQTAQMLRALWGGRGAAGGANDGTPNGTNASCFVGGRGAAGGANDGTPNGTNASCFVGGRGAAGGANDGTRTPNVTNASCFVGGRGGAGGANDARTMVTRTVQYQYRRRLQRVLINACFCLSVCWSCQVLPPVSSTRPALVDGRSYEYDHPPSRSAATRAIVCLVLYWRAKLPKQGRPGTKPSHPLRQFAGTEPKTRRGSSRGRSSRGRGRNGGRPPGCRKLLNSGASLPGSASGPVGMQQQKQLSRGSRSTVGSPTKRNQPLIWRRRAGGGTLLISASEITS